MFATRFALVRDGLGCLFRLHIILLVCQIKNRPETLRAEESANEQLTCREGLPCCCCRKLGFSRVNRVLNFSLSFPTCSVLLKNPVVSRVTVGRPEIHLVRPTVSQELTLGDCNCYAGRAVSAFVWAAGDAY